MLFLQSTKDVKSSKYETGMTFSPTCIAVSVMYLYIDLWSLVTVHIILVVMVTIIKIIFFDIEHSLNNFDFSLENLNLNIQIHRSRNYNIF